MKNNFFVFFVGRSRSLSGLLFAFLFVWGGNQIQAQTFSIKGIVQDTSGLPLPGATVYLHETKAGSNSDSSGYFAIKNVKKGSYHLHIRFLGFESHARNLRVVDSDIEITLKLKPATFEFEEVLVESDMMKTGPKEISQTIDVVNDEYLLKNTGVNLMQSLEKIAGVNYISAGTGVAKPVIRGMSFNRIVTVDNGIVQEGQQWGSDHGLEIDQFSIGRVEILKGPASIVYGSDAMGGMMNLKPLPLPEQGILSGQLLLAGQSNTDLGGGSLMLQGNQHGFFFRIRASGRSFADYHVPADSFMFNKYILPLHNNRLKNTAGNEQAFSATAGVNKSWGVSQLNASVFKQQNGFFPGAHGRPNAGELADDGNRRNIGYPYQEVQHIKISSNTNVLFKKNWLESDIGYQLNQRSEHEFPHAEAFRPKPNSDTALMLRLHILSASLRYHLYMGEKWQHVIGFSGKYKYNQRSGFSFLLPNFTSLDGGIYLFSEYKKSEKVTYSGGLRADAGQVSIQSFSDTLYNASLEAIGLYERTPALTRQFSTLSGSIGASWIVSEYVHLKCNAGSSFRYPTVPELASNGLHHGAFRYERGNSSLQPERGYQADVHFSWQKKKVAFRVTPFFNFIYRYIYLSPSPHYASPYEGGGQIYAYKQGDVLFAGYEVSTDLHLAERWHIALIHDAVYNYNLQTALPLPFSAPASITLEKEYTWLKKKNIFRQWYLGADARYVFTQNRVERNEKTTPGYLLFNTSLGGNIRCFGDEVIVSIQVRNILDIKYFNHLSIYRPLNLPEPGRNFLLTIRIPFTILKKEN